MARDESEAGVMVGTSEDGGGGSDGGGCAAIAEEDEDAGGGDVAGKLWPAEWDSIEVAPAAVPRVTTRAVPR